MKKSITDIPLKGRRVIMQVENISLKDWLWKSSRSFSGNP